MDFVCFSTEDRDCEALEMREEQVNFTLFVYVPKESVEAYQNAYIWRKFYEIIGVDVPEDEDTAVGDVFDPNNSSATRKVIENGHIYLLTPDGCKLTLQGTEVK